MTKQGIKEPKARYYIERYQYSTRTYQHTSIPYFNILKEAEKIKALDPNYSIVVVLKL